jgi:hypothetical protein
MHRYLRRHPEVFLPQKKELFFFRRHSSVTEEDLDRYLHYFEPGSDHRARGEATPAYFHWPHETIPTIQEVYGDTADDLRFILLLRDPVERFFSHYLHLRRDETETRSIEEVVEAIDPADITMDRDWTRTYYQEGLYARQLRPWLDAFEREQFCILQTESLAADPQTVLQRVFAFLNADPAVRIDADRRYNQASEIRSDWIQRFLTDPPSWIHEFVTSAVPRRTRRWVRERLGEMNRSPLTEKPSMPPTVRETLRLYYQSDVQELEKLLGRDFESWQTVATEHKG